MSRRLRPSRHVRGADREHLSRALCQVVRDVFDRAPARSLWRTSGWLSQAARALHTRPSVVRAWGETKKLAALLARADRTVKHVVAESEKVPDEDSRRTLFIDTVVRRLQAHVRPPAPPVEAPPAADVLLVDTTARDLECRKCGCPMSADDHQFRECHATDGDLCAWTPHTSHDYPLHRGHCGTCDAHIDEADALKPCPEPRKRTKA